MKRDHMISHVMTLTARAALAKRQILLCALIAALVISLPFAASARLFDQPAALDNSFRFLDEGVTELDSSVAKLDRSVNFLDSNVSALMLAQNKQAIDPIYLAGMKSGRYPKLEKLLRLIEKKTKIKIKRVTRIAVVKTKAGEAIVLDLISNKSLLSVRVDVKTLNVGFVE